jgi:3'-phosphoadenosine 5'-phosphosulfate sulfotransferase (PAPS reductase)/FAD synthetase
VTKKVVSVFVRFSCAASCTGHNFPETIEFRDRLVKELGLELIVRNVQDAIDKGKVSEKLENIQVGTVCKLQHF